MKCMGLINGESQEDIVSYEYDCPEHGPHNGSTVGGKPVHSCPICTEAKRRENHQKWQNNAIIVPFADIPWARDWVIEEADAAGVTLQDFVARVVAEMVPADYVKAHALRGMRKP